MKATGIVRRIDELGRVVIPKEIRRTMRIKEGEELEIFTTDDGELILKKYSSIGVLSELAKEYCKLLYSSTGNSVLMTDNDCVIEGAGKLANFYSGKKITNSFFKSLNERKLVIFGENELSSFTSSTPITPVTMAVVPIIKGGDIFGSIVMLTDKSRFSDSEISLLKAASDFIACSL